MKNRPVAILLALAALLSGLAGCTAPHMVDVNKRILAFAVGIDAGDEPGTVTLSLQFFAVSPGDQESGPGRRFPIVKTVTAPSVGAGWTQLKNQLPGTMYKGTVELVVLGEELARSGVRTVMDDLLRHPLLPVNLDVAITRGTAHQFLTQEVREREGPAVFAVDMLAGPGKRSLDLWRMLDGALNSWGTTLVPALEQTETGINMAGYAVFQGDKMVRLLPADQAELLIASRRRHTADLQLAPLDEGKAPMTLHLTHFRIKSRLLPDGSTAHVAIAGTGVLVEGPDVTLAGVMDRELQKHAASTIRDRVLTTLKELYSDGVDVLNLSQQARRRTADGRIPPNWSEQVRQMRFQVTATGKIVHGERGN